MNAPAATTLSVLGGSVLVVDGAHVHLTAGEERLVGYLALADGWQRRPRVAGTLWPDRPDRRALASLRTLLWRIGRSTGDHVVDATDDQVRLHPDVQVDVRAARDVAASIRMGGQVPDGAIDLLSADLLPDVDDDWSTLARERHLQLRVSALEALSQLAVREHDLDTAMQAALVAVAADRLRASAHAAVISACLAAGDVGRAQRQLHEYENELVAAGFRSSAAHELAALIEPHLPAGQLAAR